MATFKHISSKNADYGAAEQYLTFEHDEFSMKPTLDKNGQIVPRTGYLISSLNCGDEDFAIACMRSNLKYGKNQRKEDVKSHHYIISFDPRDAADNGLSVDRAQQLGEQFCKEHFPGHQALVCTHPDGHNHSGNIHVHILENREYTGCLVNFKTEKVSYKVKQSRENPVEKQAVFENHHEPIIDSPTWERVQELRRQRKRPNRYDEVGLFSGILFCADCGSVMYQQRYQTDKRRQDCYICGSYKKRTADCTAHFIRTDYLTAGVTENLRKVTSYAAKHEARFMKQLIQQGEDGDKRRNAAKKKELEAAEKRITELSAIFKRLYEDSVAGRISDERFMELSADYEAEQKELKEKAAALQNELSRTLEAAANAEKFMGVLRRHTTIEELTPTLLREFVEKIVVHESEAPDGKRRGKLRRQEIEIYYSFVGRVELPD